MMICGMIGLDSLINNGNNAAKNTIALVLAADIKNPSANNFEKLRSCELSELNKVFGFENILVIPMYIK